MLVPFIVHFIFDQINEKMDIDVSATLINTISIKLQPLIIIVIVINITKGHIISTDV